MRAYSNNGHSFRAWEDPTDLLPGEVFFDHEPSEAELTNVFPHYGEHVGSSLTRIFKADIWRRATDAEAETIDTALRSQPVRMRRLWDDSQWLETTDELYPTLEAAFVAAFGAERAAELLEPTA